MSVWKDGWIFLKKKLQFELLCLSSLEEAKFSTLTTGEAAVVVWEVTTVIDILLTQSNHLMQAQTWERNDGKWICRLDALRPPDGLIELIKSGNAPPFLGTGQETYRSPPINTEPHRSPSLTSPPSQGKRSECGGQLHRFDDRITLRCIEPFAKKMGSIRLD